LVAANADIGVAKAEFSRKFLRPAQAAVHLVETPAFPGLAADLDQPARTLDKAIESTAQNRYPETIRLRQISGVGPITALQYVLTIGDPARFTHSRDVPAYLGLMLCRHQSGSIEQQLRISKAGNKQLRSLLVQCAQYLLGRFGPDSDLKRWGTRMFERGGKNSKKRAIVAVARKLAVLLHRLWITGDTYHPLYNVSAASVAS
jgi:transposase